MAGELPDLNKQNVGWIAYYNVIDNTDVTQSDLTDGTTEGSDGPAEIESMISDRNNENIDYYDNGVIVTYYGPTRLVKIRFKTDGWITAHMNRNKDYKKVRDNYEGTRGENGVNGIHDIVHWNDEGLGDNAVSESSLVTNTLERSIKTALEQMDIYGTDIESNYDPNDVELYSYEFETNNVTLLSDARSGIEGIKRYDFQYTEATSAAHVAIAASSRGYDETGVFSETQNTDIVNPDNNDKEWAAINATSAFNNLDSGDPYRLQGDIAFDTPDRQYSVHVVVVWS